MPSNSPLAAEGAGRHARSPRWPFALAMALVLGLACAGPALAQFTSHEGFTDDGAPKLTFELAPFAYLPHTHATIGLDRPAGEDIVIDRPRPTVAEAAAALAGAFDCECLVRYGKFSGEVDLIYLSLNQKTRFPPVPPDVPEAVLNSKVSTFFISPGVGYRIYGSRTVSMDARAGFTYASLSVDADFAAGEFAASKSKTISFAQPWIGERLDYYPSSRWRLENVLDLTGLGVNGGAIGWRAKVAASYLVTKWFDVTAGYMAQRTKRDAHILPDGQDRNINILLYGPMVSLGFRF